MSGLLPGSSSSVAVRRITCGSAGRSAIRWLPQTEQKCRFLPGEDSKTLSLSVPPSHRNFSRGTRPVVVNGAAWALRQVRQEQWPIARPAASASYVTAPHKQLPFISSPVEIEPLPG